MNLPTTMKIVEITVPGGPEVLKLQDSNVPVPQADEVLVRLKPLELTALMSYSVWGYIQCLKGLLKSLDLKLLE